jgi:hypothetical protein
VSDDHARTMPALTERDFYQQGVKDERARVVRWLRSTAEQWHKQGAIVSPGATHQLADAIEAGEHAE